MRNVVAPSPPSTTTSTKSSEGVAVPTPAALRGGVSSKPSARAAEARRLREEALRLQEEQEERELKLRRKVRQSGRGQVGGAKYRLGQSLLLDSCHSTGGRVS